MWAHGVLLLATPSSLVHFLLKCRESITYSTTCERNITSSLICTLLCFMWLSALVYVLCGYLLIQCWQCLRCEMWFIPITRITATCHSMPLRFICYSRNTKAFVIGINIFASISLVALSILNRHIQKKNFNNNSGVNAFVYVSTIVGLFGSIIGRLLGDRNIHYVFFLWELCFLLSVFVVCLFLFLPRAWPVFSKNDCSPVTDRQINGRVMCLL